MTPGPHFKVDSHTKPAEAYQGVPVRIYVGFEKTSTINRFPDDWKDADAAAYSSECCEGSPIRIGASSYIPETADATPGHDKALNAPLL